MQKRAVGSERATWACVLGLLGGAAISGCVGYCPPQQELPEGDPCHGKDACDTVEIAHDGGSADVDGGSSDVDAGTTIVFCGCCNG